MRLPPPFLFKRWPTYVACNVYVSAGGEIGHGPILLDLLRQAQSMCQPGKVSVVHAYADPVYNRSSFHLVGQAEPLSNVAASLASGAIRSLRSYASTTTTTPHPSSTRPMVVKEETDRRVHHPYVGFVDHVSIMPVEGKDSIELNTNDDESDCDRDNFVPSTPSGIAARYVGKVLQEELGIQVYYYGSAHPQGIPLATIRRDKTRFFRSGGLSNKDGNDVERSRTIEVATIGAPLEFVENYNIRMKSTCSKKIAQSLTRHVRERDGGLSGVEALTLPYSQGRWEVACNLLHPTLASVNDIDNHIQSWQQQQQSTNFVESAYRVGTTSQQCLECITNLNDSSAWKKHNTQVEDRLKLYLS